MPETSRFLEHVPLKGSRRHHRPGAQVLGRSNRHEFCEITVKLRRKQALPEPVPGKAVISRQAVASYGASEADMDTVAKCFTGYGLTGHLQRFSRTLNQIDRPSRKDGGGLQYPSFPGQARQPSIPRPGRRF